jgi:haloalkane dehalogenase
MDIFRTSDEAFEKLDFPFRPNWREDQGLRLHYLDEGPLDGPVALLVHGEPTWSYVYRKMIPALVARGFRCIAPDHAGFGKSDKPTDETWYDLLGHVRRLSHLVSELDLKNVTLFVQDWGGPIGLRLLVDEPERFERVVIMSTWLHRDEYNYSAGIRQWAARANNPAELGGDMDVGRIVAGSLLNPKVNRREAYIGYSAPFDGYDSKAGARRFPSILPFRGEQAGDPQGQQRCFEALPKLGLPMHFFWGDGDIIFPPSDGEHWSSMIPGSTFDIMKDAGHFIQEDAGLDIVNRMDKYW